MVTTLLIRCSAYRKGTKAMATSCVAEAHREVNDEDRVTGYTLEEMDGEICKK